jgi:AcrR family transcriptional regulator
MPAPGPAAAPHPLDPLPDDRPRRASALPATERRAAIVAATVPLVMEHGAAVTTRQIAEAAGVAEGTIFRVFADKDELIRAAVEAVFDTAPLVAALDGIDRALPLEARLLAAIDIIRQRLENIWHLAAVVGATTVAAQRSSIIARRGRNDLDAIARLFEPERDRLSVEPPIAAQMLRGLTIAGFHPSLASEVQLSADDIVSVLLDGIRRQAC